MPYNSDLWRYDFLLNYLYSLEEETRREYWRKNTRSKVFNNNKRMKRSFKRSCDRNVSLMEENARGKLLKRFRPMVSSSEPILQSKCDEDVKRLLRQNSRKRSKRGDSLPRQYVDLTMEGCGGEKTDGELQRIRLVKELSNRRSMVLQHPVQLYPVSSTKRKPLNSKVNYSEYIPPAVFGKDSKCKASCSKYGIKRFSERNVNRRSTVKSQTDNSLPPDDSEIKFKPICLQQDGKTPCNKISHDESPGLNMSGSNKKINVKVSVMKKTPPEQQIKAAEPLPTPAEKPAAKSVTEPMFKSFRGSTQTKCTNSKCQLYNCETFNKESKYLVPEKINDFSKTSPRSSNFQPPEETFEPVKDLEVKCAANRSTETTDVMQDKILAKENKETLVEERRKNDDTKLQTPFNDFSVRLSIKSKSFKLECPIVLVEAEPNLMKCGAESRINVDEKTEQGQKDSKIQNSIATLKCDEKACSSRNKKCQMQSKSKSSIQIIVDTDNEIRSSNLPIIMEESVMGSAPPKLQLVNFGNCTCTANKNGEHNQDSAATITEDLSNGQTPSQIDMQQNCILKKYKMEMCMLQSEYDERKKILQAMHNKRLELLDLKKKMIMKKCNYLSKCT